MRPPSLAVVIPAWKPDFLALALASLKAQTNRDFRLYVGDDASPHDLRAIVETSGLGERVVYHRFPTNLGGVDLVAHWERCIDLVASEEWIWLFSDDDLADPDCVAAFRTNVQTYSTAVLHHFAVRRIDASGAVLSSPPPRQHDGPLSLLRGRFLEAAESFVIEYIFHRQTFELLGRFQRFDLAWGSDDATWIKFARVSPPRLIPGPRVSWRESDKNISPDLRPELIIRKSQARLAFLVWVIETGIVDSRTAPLAGTFASWYFGNLRHPVVQLPLADLLRLAGRYRLAFPGSWGATAAWVVRLVLVRTWRIARSYLRRAAHP